MLFEKILEESKKLLAQYRDIPSLDKSRDMLVAKYGEQDFAAIRQLFAQKWLEDHGMWSKLPLLKEPPQKEVKSKKKKTKTQGMRDLESRLKGGKKRLTRYEKKQSARAAAIISPKPGPKVPYLCPDKVKDESITTHKSIHTLRG